MGLRNRLFAILTAALMAVGLGVGVAAPAQAGCGVAARIFTVAGSGQGGNALRGYEVSFAASTLQGAAAAAGRSVQIEQVVYPAVPWTRYVRVSRNWNGLEDSVQQGVNALRRTLTPIFENGGCIPAIVLIGYSQGADVVARVANAFPAAWQDFIVIGQMGNPSFMPGRSQNFGNYERILWGVRPSFAQTTSYITSPHLVPRTIDACLDNDPICNYDILDLPGLANGRSAHYNYIGSGYAAIVGNTLWRYVSQM
jgi:hypothetical protein